MMHLLIIWRNICDKPLQSVLSIAVTASSIALTIVVMLLASSVQQGLVKAAEPFDLIVGAKGSPNQLVLNTVFLQDAPIGNIDFGLVDTLMNNPLVESAIPLGLGDNYRGFRMIGTQESLFAHQIKSGGAAWLQMADGKPFARPFEAVIGAKVAAETGLGLGDQFDSSHGVILGAGQVRHPEKFTVVGILKELNGPYDSGVLVPLESVWDMHAAHQDISSQDTPTKDRSTTVILVKPKGYAEAMLLYQQFQKNAQAQLIFPSQVVVKLFAMLGEGEKILRVIGGAVLVLSMLVTAFSLYWSALSRSRDRAILRAVGAGRRTIWMIIFGEGTLLVVISLLLGTIAGHGIFAMIAEVLQKKTALAVTGGFTGMEVIVLLSILAVGMLASIIPAIRMARRDIADDL